MTQQVIGVDIGTQSTKAVLVGADGRIVAQASQAYQVETPKPLWAQQWPQVWLSAVEATVREVATHGTSIGIRIRQATARCTQFNAISRGPSIECRVVTFPIA